MRKYLLVVIISLFSTLVVNAQCNSRTDVAGATGQTGLYAEYFAGYFADNPSFFPATISTYNRKENNLNYTGNNWGVTRPPATGTGGDQNQFSARYRGSINITTAGTYTFYLNSDDGSYMFIDNDALTYPVSLASAFISNGGVHADATVSNSIYLTAGFHNIQILFGEDGGDNVLRLRYSGPGIAGTVVVPQAALCTGIQPAITLPAACACKDLKGNNATAGLLAEYYAGYFNDVQSFFTTNTPGLTRVDNNVNFVNNWGAIVPPAANTVADPDYFSVRWTGSFNAPVAGSYTFYLTSDDASFLWINNAAVTTTPVTANATINDGGLHGNTTVAATVVLTAGINYIKIHYGENAGGNTSIFEVESVVANITRQPVPNSLLCTSFLPPEPTVPADTIVYCLNATAVPLTATGTALKWYTVATGGTSSAIAPTPSTTTVGYTSYYVSQTIGGCESLRKRIVVSVTPLATITLTSAAATSTQSVCINMAMTPIVYTIANGTGATVTGLPTGVTGAYLAGVYTISGTPTVAGSFPYTVTATGCSSPTATGTITVTPVPSATISYAGTPFCTSIATAQSVTQTGTTGGTYSSTVGLTINAATGAITPSTSTAGTYTVTYTVPASGGCPIYTTTTSVVITAAPNATISYAGPFCNSNATAQNVTRTGTAGGAYTAAPTGLTINAATGAITPSTSTAGTYTVTYTIAASAACPVYTTTASVTITPTPSATISYAGTPFCRSIATAQSVSQTGTTGGTYSSTLGLTINATTGDITPSTSTAGTYTVTYTVAAAGGCAVYTTTTSVTITTAPNATIAYAGPFCSNNATVQNVTRTGTAGGTYTAAPTGLTINAGTGAITPSTSTAGTYTITYTIAASAACPIYTTTTTVTITPLPSATISYAGTPFCRSNATPQSVTQTGTTGGTYSSTLGLTIDGTTGDITPSTSTAGTYTVTYTVAAAGGCAVYTTTTSVTITTAPNATIAYAGPFCSNNATVQNVTRTGTAGGTYTAAPAGLTINAGTGAITPSTSTAGTYTVTYTVAGSGGCAIYTTTATVTITPVPSATISYAGTPFCRSNATPQSVTQTGTTGGTYSSTLGLTIDGPTGAITPSTSTAGTYTVTYTVAAAGGCAAYTTTTSVTITTAPNATIAYAGPFCSNNATVQNVTRTGTAGGTYTAAPAGLTINAGTGAITPSTSTAGTYTITYTVAGSGGCAIYTTTATVTITPVPSATISYAGPFCTSNATAQSVTQTGTTGGTYSSTLGLTIDGTTGAITPSTSLAGTYTVTYTVAAANGCAVYTTTTSVTITTAPAATIGYAGPFCNNNATAQNVTRTGTAGGAYSAAPAGLTINAGTGAITPSTSTAGTYTVTYTIAAAGGCAVYTTTASVTITAAPSATISYAGPFCTSTSTAQSVTQTGTAGGTYSSTLGLFIDGTTGAITPSSSLAGTYTVTYTVAAANGCAVYTTTTSVTITTAPAATISYAGPYCTSNATAQNVIRIGTAGGAYSAAPAGLTINTSTGAITPSTSTAGTYTVTYTIAAAGGCAVYTTTASVTITAAPSATISYAGPFCTSNATAQSVTQTGTAGGTYSSTLGLTIDGTTGAIAPSTSTAGTYTVTYTVPASGGCAVYTTTTSVTITTAPVATISYAGPYCTSNATAQNVTRTGTAGGAYTVAPTGLTINASTGAITPSTSTAGTYTVTYTIAATGGCPVFTTTASVTITAAPSATISYAGPFCTNTATAQSVTQTGTTGGTYSASPTGLTISSSTGAITPSTSTTGTYTVTYTVAASGGCAVYTTTTSVIITTAPSATINYAGSPICTSAGVQNVTQTGTTGGTYSSTAGLTLDGTTGAITPGTSTAGTYTVTYGIAATGGCAAYSTTTSVTITTAPSATISYTGPFCTSNATAQNATRTGTAGGTYSASPTGLTINASTGAITPSTSTAGTYTVTYTIAASGGCPIYTTTTSVTITATPSATIIYPVTTICSSAGVQNVTQTGTTGGVYSSTVGLTLDPSTGTITPATSTGGTYTVTYTIAAAGGCAAFTTTTSVTITTAPAATISYASPFCTSNATAQNVTRTGTAGGSYSSATGLIINVTTGAITPSVSTPGTYTVTYTVAATGGCPVYTTTTSVTITAAPSATISYAGPFCTSNATAQNVTQTGTTGGTYSSTAGLTLDGTTGAITPSTSTAGTYTVTYTIAASGGCAVYTTTTNVTITIAPAATISYAGPFCRSNVTPQNVTRTGTAGGTYFATPAGLSIVNSTGAITPSSSTAGTYTVTYSIAASGGCAAYTTTTSVTITAAPSATISYGTPFCTSVATAQNVTQTGSTGGVYSSTTGLTLDATTGAITPGTSTAGTYTVTYTIAAAGGCALYTTTTSVTITTAPTASISYAGSPMCTSAGVQSVTQTGNTGGTYSSATGLTLDATTGAITPGTSTAGTYTVTYTIAASGGCALYTTTTSVTITAAPTATISYAGSPMCTSAGVQSVTQIGSTGGVYSSTTGLTLDATTGAITPGTSTAGTYTVTYTIAAAGGCALYTTTTSVTITTAPTANISYAGSPMCTSAGVQSVTQTGNTGGTYSSATGLTLDATTGAITPGTSTAGTYTVTYTIAASGGCALYTTTTSVTITAAPAATINYAGSPICTSSGVQSVTQTGSTGGIYSSTTGLTIDATTGDITPGTSTAGTYTVTYTIAAAGGCALYSTTTSVTITTAPAATISYAGPFCTSLATAQNVTQTGNTGGVYSSAAGLTLDATTGTITPGTSTAGTYTVTYTIAASGGCALYATTTSVTITAAPTATITYAGSPICTSSGVQSVTQTGNTGGVYSSATGLTLNATTGDIDPSTSTAGTYTVTYTIAAAGGCALYSTTTSVTITTAPAATISYAGPFCTSLATAQNVTQTGNTGGVYSSATGLTLDAITGAITPGTSTAGTYTVTYTIAAAGGCALYTTTTSVTITAAPTATITYAGSPICTNAGVQSVTQTGNTGGVYSTTAGLTLNATTGDIDPSTSTAGTYTVTYRIAAAGGCALYSTTTSVTISLAPSATISYTGPFCTSDATPEPVTHTGTIGGTYSSTTGLTLDPTTGDIDPSTSTAGTYTVTYTVAASGGCALYTTTTSVTITTAPTATITYAGSPICTNAGIQSVTQTGNTGGTYSSTAGLTINATTGAITPSTSTAGTYTVTYTIAAAGGCAVYTTNTSVTISTAPSGTISYGATPICTSAGLKPVTHTGTTGGIYSSTTGLTLNPTTGEIDPSTSTPGTYTVTYTIAAANGCAVFTTTANVTINLGLTIVTDPADVTVCEFTTANFSVTATGSGVLTYQWRKNGTNIVGATSSTFSIPSTAPSDAGNYDVVVNSSCGTPDTSAIAVLIIQQVPRFTKNPSDTTVCENTPSNLSVGATGANVTYQWYKGLTAITGATSAIYSIPLTSTSDAGSYYVVIGGTCGMPLSSTAAILTVNSNPVVVTDPSDVTICENGSATFNVSATGTSLTYQWRKGGVDIAGATTSTYAINPVTVADAGSYDVTVTGVCGAPVISNAANLVVNAYTTPSVTIVSDDADNKICGGTTVVFTPTVLSGGATPSYQWYLNGFPIDTNSTYTETSLSDGDQVHLVITSSDMCVTAPTANSNTITMQVTNPAYPYVSISSDDADNTICGSTDVTFTASPIDEGTAPVYQWQINGVNVGTNNPVFTSNTLADGDTIRVFMTNTDACATPPTVKSDSIVMIVNSSLPLTLTKIDECGAFTGNGSISFNSATAGFTFDYSNGPTYTGPMPPIAATTVVGTNTIPGLTGGQYSVSLYDPGTGCAAEQSIVINTNVKPVAYAVSGGGGLCIGDGTSAPISIANSESGVLYKFIHNSTDTSASIVGSTGSISFPNQTIPGTYRVYGYSVVDSTCKTNMTGTVTIVLNPKPVIDSVKTNCLGGAGKGSITVYAKIATGTLEYSITGTTYQPSSTFTNLANGTYTVYVRESVTHCADTTIGVTFFCNLAPIAYSDFTCDSIDRIVTGNVLANDSDPDGNVIKVTAQASVITLKGGTFSVDTLGLFSYKPALGFVGFDTITYQVCDSVTAPYSLCSAGVLIIKTGTGGIYANDDVANLNMNESFTSTLSVLVNDSTSDGDTIIVSIATNAPTTSGGRITIDSRGNYSYTPAPGFHGVDSYTYTIFDRCGNVARAKITINVKEIITVTLFIPEGFSPNSDGSHDFFVLGNTEGYGQISFKVFNRWGSLVYENNDYKGPDWWDGNSNNGVSLGERLPDGTYFYEIRTDKGDKFVNYLTLKR